MDWPLAILRNREALQRIVEVLFSLAGWTERRFAEVLPRLVHSAILRILRPAESAVRRLIIIAARGLVLSPRRARAAPVNIIVGAGAVRLPAFCLIDPLKRFAPFIATLEEEDQDFADDENIGDDYPHHAFPRISLPGFYDPVFATPRDPSCHDLIDAELLARRLQALKLALDNLPKQARRLVRWQARRLLMRQQSPSRPGRVTPFRPGLPPGFRARQTHEVDDILRECHGLMRDVLAAPNSS